MKLIQIQCDLLCKIFTINTNYTETQKVVKDEFTVTACIRFWYSASCESWVMQCWHISDSNTQKVESDVMLGCIRFWYSESCESWQWCNVGMYQIPILRKLWKLRVMYCWHVSDFNTQKVVKLESDEMLECIRFWDLSKIVRSCPK